MTLKEYLHFIAVLVTHFVVRGDGKEMADYIEREAAIAWFMPYVHVGESIEADVVISDLKGMKAADVEPVKRGRWIYNAESGECVCSACGENALSFRKDTLYGVDLYETCLTDYCPNCGARMDEEVKNER